MNLFESRLSAALGVTAGKTFLAAVSGGADSTALLAGLAALRKEASDCESADCKSKDCQSSFSLYCVHVEHGIRPAEESRGDAQAVKILCEKLDVPCRVVSVPPGRIAAIAGSAGSGIEGAARQYRLRALHREARRIGADHILTAHTRDDVLETILMRVLRGCGPAGLAVMPRQSRIAGKNGLLFRPLLDLTRQDVLQYLEGEGLSYRTDSTNKDISFLRNRIRLKLVPLLDVFFPSWRSSLLALAETQALTAEFLASEAGNLLPWESVHEEHGKAGMLRLREEIFVKAPQILKEEAIFAGMDMLSSGQQKTPRRSTVRRAVSQSAAREGNLREGNLLQGSLLMDLGPARLARQKGYITLKSGHEFRGEKGFSLLIKEAGFYTLRRKNQEKKFSLHIRVCPAEANRDGAAVSYTVSYASFNAKLPLVFRNHREGDRILRGGHRRRFSDILDVDARPGEEGSRYYGVTTVCDTEGLAAFIAVGRGGEKKVIGRDTASSDGGPGYMGVYVNV